MIMMKVPCRLVLGLLVLNLVLASPPRYTRQVELDNYEEDFDKLDHDYYSATDVPEIEISTLSPDEDELVLEASLEEEEPEEAVEEPNESGDKRKLPLTPSLIPPDSRVPTVFMGPETPGEEELRLTPTEILHISGDSLGSGNMLSSGGSGASGASGISGNIPDAREYHSGERLHSEGSADVSSGDIISDGSVDLGSGVSGELVSGVSEVSGEFVSEVSGEFVSEVSGEFVSGVSGDFVSEVSGEFVSGVSGDLVSGVSEDLISTVFGDSISGETVPGVSGEFVSGVSGDSASGVSGDSASGVSGDSVSGVSVDIVSGHSGDSVSGDSGDSVSVVSGDSVSGDSVDSVSGDSVSGDSGDSVSGDSGDSVSVVSGDSVSGDPGDSVSGDSGGSVSGDSGGSVSGDSGDSVSGDFGIIISESTIDHFSGDSGDSGSVSSGTLGEEITLVPHREEEIITFTSGPEEINQDSMEEAPSGQPPPPEEVVTLGPTDEWVTIVPSVTEEEEWSSTTQTPFEEGPESTPEIETDQGMPTCLLCTCLGGSVYCDDVKLVNVPPLSKDTTHFYARFNRITKINKSDFANMNKLKRIDLTSNSILKIEDGAFYDLPALEELVIRENSLVQLPALPATMILIDASHNHLRSTGIQNEAFKDMTGLLYLYLTDNNIDHIPVPLPESLRSLHLQNNNIQMIHEDTFCKHNDFSYIRMMLEDIRLDGNPVNLSRTPQAYVCLPRIPIGALI